MSHVQLKVWMSYGTIHTFVVTDTHDPALMADLDAAEAALVKLGAGQVTIPAHLTFDQRDTIHLHQRYVIGVERREIGGRRTPPEAAP